MSAQICCENLRSGTYVQGTKPSTVSPEVEGARCGLCSPDSLLSASLRAALWGLHRLRGRRSGGRVLPHGQCVHEPFLTVLALGCSGSQGPICKLAGACRVPTKITLGQLNNPPRYKAALPFYLQATCTQRKSAPSYTRPQRCCGIDMDRRRTCGVQE